MHRSTVNKIKSNFFRITIMFPLVIVIILLVSMNYPKIINAEMIFDYPNQEPYRLHLFRIFEKYLDPGKTNFCIDCDELIHLIPRTVSLVTISRKDKKVNWPPYHKVDSYILDLTRGTKERLEFVVKTPGWNPRAKFFIIYNKKSTSYLLKVLFSKYIVDVAIFSSPDNSTLIIRTYDPFKDGELRPKVLKTKIIATITTVTDSNRQKDIFPNKYPQKWNNITVNVVPVYSPPYIMVIEGLNLRGLHMDHMNWVGRKMGIRINYLTQLPSWGEKGEDGKYNFAFGGLQLQEFDIGIGAFPVSYPEYVDFDMLYPVMEDYLIMAIPSAPVKERWKCILNIFENMTWTLCLLSIFLVTTVFHIISMTKTQNDLSTSVLICLGCFLKICVPKMPKSKLQRFLLFFWIVFCILIDIYFESHLQGAFNNVHREKQIDSFEEIKKLDMKVAINKRYLQLFNSDEAEIDHFVLRNHYETNFLIRAVNESLKYKNTVVIVLERFMKYSIGYYYVDPYDGSSTVHIVTEKLMFYPMTMYLTKGSPLFDGLQRIVHSFRTIGCIKKLYRYGEHTDQMVYHKHGTKWMIDPIDLDELKYIFFMLLCGLGFSGVILIFEILWHKSNSSKVHK